jgi:hypothetical protein
MQSETIFGITRDLSTAVHARPTMYFALIISGCALALPSININLIINFTYYKLEILKIKIVY